MGRSNEQDSMGALNKDDDDSSTDGENTDNPAGTLKRSTHSHSTCTNDKNRQQNTLLFNHNANVNLGTVYRPDNFLSHDGIPSERLALFQQEDRIPDQSHPDQNRSLRTKNIMRLMRSRPESSRNEYIIKVMNQGSNGEQSAITEQQVASGSNDVSERDQRANGRNHIKHKTSVAMQFDDVLNL